MKKVIKGFFLVLGGVLLLLLLLAGSLLVKNWWDSQKPLLPEDYYLSFQPEAPLEQKFAGLGQYEADLYKERASGTAKEYRVWIPQPAKEHETFPLILVVNASNTAASQYEPFFRRLASWGFLVAGNEDRQAGSGASTSQTLDALLQMGSTPGHPLEGKIDTERIGVIGYSQGGAGAIRAATEFENSRLYKALFTGSAAYPLLAKNLGWEYDCSKLSIPAFFTAGTGSSDDTGAADPAEEFAGVAPLSSLIENYQAMPDTVEKAYARATGAEHGDMLVRSDGYMTAWMLYHLRGDETARKVFFGESPELLTNPMWQDAEICGG